MIAGAACVPEVPDVSGGGPNAGKVGTGSAGTVSGMVAGEAARFVLPDGVAAGIRDACVEVRGSTGGRFAANGSDGSVRAACDEVISGADSTAGPAIGGTVCTVAVPATLAGNAVRFVLPEGIASNVCEACGAELC